MPMGLYLTVFGGICTVIYSFGEKISKNTFFTSKSDLNVIFGQVFRADGKNVVHKTN